MAADIGTNTVKMLPLISQAEFVSGDCYSRLRETFEPQITLCAHHSIADDREDVDDKQSSVAESISVN